MGALDNLIAAPAAKAAVPQPSGGALDQLAAKPPKSALDDMLAEAAKVPPTPAYTGIASSLESAVQPIARLPAVAKQTAAKNTRALGAALEDFKSPTVGGKALAALETLGATGAWLFTLPEAIVTSILGEPVERETGIKGSAEKIGEYGSFAAQVATDPLAAGTKVGKFVRTGKLGQAAETVLSPTTAGEGMVWVKGKGLARMPMKQSALTGLIIRQYNGKLARDTAQASHDLEQFRGLVNRLPENARFGFMDAIEHSQTQTSGELQQVANKLRSLLDERKAKIRSLGKGYLRRAIEGYFPHIWKDPKKAQTVMEALQEQMARGQSKRPLRGSGAFLKQRTVDTIMQGRARGLELVSTDPLELTLIKLREMDRFYYGTLMADTIKKTGLAKFVRYNARAPIGWKALDDRVFLARLPPAVAEHFAAYDPVIRRGLAALAKKLNITIETPLTDKILAQGAYGYTGRNIPKAVARFGADEAVLMHEIGHKLDFAYRLSEFFGRDRTAWQELGHLALERSPGTTDPRFLAYLLSPTERIANLFHAYWHAPQLFQKTAPTAAKLLDGFLTAHPDLKALTEMVKPSVRFTSETVEEGFPGIRHLGQWYAPEEVARVFNNYVSKGLYGQNALFDLVRHGANSLNMLQLGASFFHVTFTTLDTMVSRLALGIEQAMRAEFGSAAKNIIGGVLPTSALETIYKGNKLRAAYLDPGGATPELRRMVEAVTGAGGRISMDQFYRATEGRGLIRGLRDGSLIRGIQDQFKLHPFATILKTPFDIATRALQDVAHPIMDFIVPRQKLGVFYSMAEDWIRRNPNANPIEFLHVMQTAWDSVDNRLGQMVYDNVFWDKTLKDIAFIGVRSVGWNLGTIRELGGGAFDAARAVSALGSGDKIEMTHRMAYSIAMPIVTGLYGAIATYLYTGRGPQSGYDFFFPPTGKTTPHGDPERVSIPSYIKDVLEYNRAPVQTLTNKLNPIWANLFEMYHNRDFYGGIIVNPTDPVIEQLRQLGEYEAEVVTPFSIRSTRRLYKEGSSWGQLLASMFGLQAAPGFIVAPDRTAAWQRRQDNQAVRRRLREQ